jgi:hypothetical protein
MNPVMNMFGNNTAGGSNIMLQALGAALRGESPQAFMKRLANSHPQLKKMNLDDLYGSAQQLCNERGLSIDEVTKSVDNTIGSAFPK